MAARGGCGGGGAVRCREWGPPLRGERSHVLLFVDSGNFLFSFHEKGGVGGVGVKSENRPQVYPYFSQQRMTWQPLQYGKGARPLAASELTTYSGALSHAPSFRATVAAAGMSAAAMSRVAAIRGGVLPTGRRSAQARRNGTTRPRRSATIVTARLGKASRTCQLQ